MNGKKSFIIWMALVLCLVIGCCAPLTAMAEATLEAEEEVQELTDSWAEQVSDAVSDWTDQAADTVSDWAEQVTDAVEEAVNEDDDDLFWEQLMEGTEEKTTDVTEEDWTYEGETVTGNNPILMVIQSLKTADWSELPAELKERISELGWNDLQEQIKNYDWSGALGAIKSFFTDHEWGEFGAQIEGIYQQLMQLAMNGSDTVKGFVGELNVDEFIGNLQMAAGQLARQVKNWTGQAGELANDAVETVKQTITEFLRQLGIF